MDDGIEAGIADEQYIPQQASPVGEFPPTDIIELSKDFFQPSATYSEFNSAVQKDIVLGNLTKETITRINLMFDNVQDCTLLMAKNKSRWAYLNNTVNYYLAKIALMVSESRGEGGFTARLMRSTFHEQKATMQELQGREKQRGGLRNAVHNYAGI